MPVLKAGGEDHEETARSKAAVAPSPSALAPIIIFHRLASRNCTIAQHIGGDNRPADGRRADQVHPPSRSFPRPKKTCRAAKRRNGGSSQSQRSGRANVRAEAYRTRVAARPNQNARAGQGASQHDASMHCKLDRPKSRGHHATDRVARQRQGQAQQHGRDGGPDG